MEKIRITVIRVNSFFKKHWGRIVQIFVLAMLLSLNPSPNKYFIPIKKTEGLLQAADITLPSPPPYPINKTDARVPSVSAQGIVIKDIPSGIVLYAKNETIRFPPASTTKIMTALVSLSHYKLDDVLTVTTIINSGSSMKLVSGEKITADALLYGALVHSANDAAYTLAENYPGGVTAFVVAMNQKAKDLYLTNTNFANPIGFDDPNQYTTPLDLTKLATIALSNSTFAKIVGTRAITVSDESFTYFHDLKNVNELLGKVAGVAGVKTGYTEFAGEILVSEVRKNGQSIIISILKSNNRFGETQQLINWVFENFSWLPLAEVTPGRVTSTTENL